MITLLCASLEGFEIGKIIGYIVSSLEIIFVLLRVIRCFIPSDCKFAQWMDNSLKSLGSLLSSGVETPSQQDENKEDDDDE